MSLLKFFSKAPHCEGSSSESETSGRDDDPLTTLWNSDSHVSPLAVTRDDVDLSDSASLGKSALASWSDTAASETSLPLPPESHARYIRICQGPYQPRLPKYKVTVHRGKGRSFCSKCYDFHNWLETQSSLLMNCTCLMFRKFTFSILLSTSLCSR